MIKDGPGFPEGGGLRERVRDGLERLAFGSFAGVLPLLSEEAGAEPDLFCVSELKRGKNGVEVRFCDRFRAMEALLRLDEAEAAGGDTLPLCRALLESAQPAEADGSGDGGD